MNKTFKILKASAIICLIILICFKDSYSIDSSQPIKGQFIVRLKENFKPDIVQQSLTTGLNIKKISVAAMTGNLNGQEIWDRVFIISDSTATQSLSDIRLAIGTDNIEYIEEVYPLEFFDFPADSLFSQQWYLHNSGQEYFGIKRIEGFENDSLILKRGTPGNDINLNLFYNNPPAVSTKVVVAIVDTGVDSDHPELTQNIWNNPDEIPENNIDDDHNGFVDDIIGYDVSGDFISFTEPVGDNDPSDEVGHGTHVAGIIGSQENGFGIVGIAPDVEIMAVKIRPNATTAVGAAGIIYAVIAGAKVINISWGTPFESGVLRDALKFARDNQLFVSIAAGNTGDNQRFYPAAFDSSFTVGAGNSRGYLTDFSTYGAHVDIVAPGEDILSLRASGTDMYRVTGEPGVRIIGADSLYYLSDGTSMAAPMVAGAAALIWSIRPDLNLSQLEQIIRMGADDMLDPLNNGDTLAGPDSLSGYGYLNIAASYDLILNGGLRFTKPILRDRLTAQFEIVITTVSGYSGEWLLEYKFQESSLDWQYLADGEILNFDSVSSIFSSNELSGNLLLKVTDKFGSSSSLSVVYVRENKIEIVSPVNGQELKYSTPIIGSAYGLGFDSMAIFSRNESETLKKLSSSSGEYFDSLLYNWAVSGIDTGNFKIYLYGYYSDSIIADSVSVHVESAFAAGWPAKYRGIGAISPAVADINGDGNKELVIGTTNGLAVFTHDGRSLPNFPVLLGINMRSVPALYDIDHDGLPEIICTNASGIHVFNHDGSYAEGWPVECYTGRIPFGYGYPNPTIAALGDGQDSVIMIINKHGDILAYNFDGSSYFSALDGLFGSFNPRVTDFLSFGGQTSPFVTTADVNGDGLFDVVGGYSILTFPYEGIGLFESTTGRPLGGREDEVVAHFPTVLGTVLADLNNDGNPEIIATGIDSSGIPAIWAVENGTEIVSGFPVYMPALKGWIGSYPVVADLDLDGRPEILCTFFEFDIGALYIFNADGSPYLGPGDRPAGQAVIEPVTFGTAVVANLTGDRHPEIVIRGGHILPGTGTEQVFIYDYELRPIKDWPNPTPARPSTVFSSRYSPLIDDLDNDGKVELILISDANEMLVWDFDASSNNGNNTGRFLVDNRNSGTVILNGIATDIDIKDDDPSPLPVRFTLKQNYPNPFNPQTTFTFSLPVAAHANLSIYNILGQKVVTVLDEKVSAGEHSISFDASDLPTGIYFYRLSTENATSTKKMVLIK